MCQNGVNTGQYKMMLEQIDDQIALNRRWAHRLGHTAGDAGFEKTCELMHQVQHVLDDARALITDAQDALDEDAEAAANVSVKLV